jgi:hypothetical protein
MGCSCRSAWVTTQLVQRVRKSSKRGTVSRRAVIKSRATGRSYPRTLLSSIATCEVCGHTLASRPKGEGKPAYVCARDLGGCGRIVILATDFEEDVLARLFRSSG